MNGHDDKRLASRFAAVATDPLPGDWDDVLGKAGAGRSVRVRRERSRTDEGRRRRRIVALAAAALVAAPSASSFSIGASSACRPWGRNQALRKAASSSSTGTEGARATRSRPGFPLSAPGCTPTGE